MVDRIVRICLYYWSVAGSISLYLLVCCLVAFPFVGKRPLNDMNYLPDVIFGLAVISYLFGAYLMKGFVRTEKWAKYWGVNISLVFIEICIAVIINIMYGVNSDSIETKQFWYSQATEEIGVGILLYNYILYKILLPRRD